MVKFFFFLIATALALCLYIPVSAQDYTIPVTINHQTYTLTLTLREGLPVTVTSPVTGIVIGTVEPVSKPVRAPFLGLSGVDDLGISYTVTLPPGFTLLAWNVSEAGDEYYTYDFSFGMPKGKRIESGTVKLTYYDAAGKVIASMLYVSIGYKEYQDFENWTVTAGGWCMGVKCLAAENGARYTITVRAKLIDWP